MPKKLNFGTAILCTYVVKGEHGKHTLVDVFGGHEIRVSNLPGAIQLGIYVEFDPEIDTPHVLEAEVLFNKKGHAKIGFEMAEMTPGTMALLAVPGFPFAFNEEGTLEIVVSGEGLEPTTVITKRIIADRSLKTTASPPPS